MYRPKLRGQKTPLMCCLKVWKVNKRAFKSRRNWCTSAQIDVQPDSPGNEAQAEEPERAKARVPNVLRQSVNDEQLISDDDRRKKNQQFWGVLW